MNDGNDKHEGAWWGNLETLKPSQVQSDYSYVDEDDRRKKFIIIAAVIGIVLVLLLGGVTAFTVLSSNKVHDSDTKKEQTQTQKKETSTENAKKKKSAEKSAISVMVTADGAAEDSKASVSVSEKGKNGKIVVKDISVTKSIFTLSTASNRIDISFRMSTPPATSMRNLRSLSPKSLQKPGRVH